MYKTERGIPTWISKPPKCFYNHVAVLMNNNSVDWKGIDLGEYATICRLHAVKGKKVTKRKLARRSFRRCMPHTIVITSLPGTIPVMFSLMGRQLVYVDIYTKVSDKIQQFSVYLAGEEFYVYNVPVRFIAPYTPGIY